VHIWHCEVFPQDNTIVGEDACVSLEPSKYSAHTQELFATHGYLPV
jgi:hypothetical protein